jgi:outer membrane protein OmpA-like peptidoglycan-associated protein
MAELLLLLLFCLLLVSTATLLRKDEEIETLKELTRVTADIDANEVRRGAGQLQILLRKLFPDGVPKLKDAEFAKLWETIVLARNLQDAAAGAGVESPEKLEQLLTVLGEASGRPASADELEKLAAVLERLVRAGARDMSNEQLEALVASVSTSGSIEAKGPLDASWPPIISLDGNRYRFRTGSAAITPEFEDYLVNDAAAKIADLLRQYDADVIEIVGHTDEQVIEPTEQRLSNLDKVALPAVNGATNDELIPVDNAGLGLARAIAVARVLRNQPDLLGKKVVPLSAGQLLRKGDFLSTGVGDAADDPDRRRIEIRVRRSTPETN